MANWFSLLLWAFFWIFMSRSQPFVQSLAFKGRKCSSHNKSFWPELGFFFNEFSFSFVSEEWENFGAVFLLVLALFALQEEQMQPDMQTIWEARARNISHALQGCCRMGRRQVISWFWKNRERRSSEPQPRVRSCWWQRKWLYKEVNGGQRAPSSFPSQTIIYKFPFHWKFQLSKNINLRKK